MMPGKNEWKISDKHIFNTGLNELSEIVVQGKKNHNKTISEHTRIQVFMLKST